MYTGKRRGRPPRVPPLPGTIPQNQNGRLSTDSNHSYLDHEHPSPSEENPLESAFNSNLDAAKSNEGGDYSAMQSVSVDGSPLKAELYGGLTKLVRNGGESSTATPGTVVFNVARASMSPLKQAVVLSGTSLPLRGNNRPRKKTLSPEDGGSAGN